MCIGVIRRGGRHAHWKWVSRYIDKWIDYRWETEQWTESDHFGQTCRVTMKRYYAGDKMIRNLRRRRGEKKLNGR